jgi:hypothetical protein
VKQCGRAEKWTKRERGRSGTRSKRSKREKVTKTNIPNPAPSVMRTARIRVFLTFRRRNRLAGNFRVVANCMHKAGGRNRKQKAENRKQKRRVGTGVAVILSKKWVDVFNGRDALCTRDRIGQPVARVATTTSKREEPVFFHSSTQNMALCLRSEPLHSQGMVEMPFSATIQSLCCITSY